MPTIQKSSRHSKITGDFAEHLVLYWLSKHGFECACIDHVGMDLIARRPQSDVPLGISVKCRSRNPGSEGSYMSIPNDNFAKLEIACAAFGCEPFFAIIIDEAEKIDAYLLSSITLQELFPQRERVSSWKMTREWRERYNQDSRIMQFQLTTQTTCWWAGPPGI